ncbi:hypothetical protein BHM03_00061085, partial [Ensete ventricosum]
TPLLNSAVVIPSHQIWVELFKAPHGTCILEFGSRDERLVMLSVSQRHPCARSSYITPLIEDGGILIMQIHCPTWPALSLLNEASPDQDGLLEKVLASIRDEAPKDDPEVLASGLSGGVPLNLIEGTNELPKEEFDEIIST